MKPFYRWVGGKTRMLPSIMAGIIGARPIFNYFETFFGGGALFFHLHHKIDGAAYLNDSNTDLVEMLNEVKDHPERLVRALLELQDRAEDYYVLRDRFNLKKSELSAKHKAALFLALNHMGYNGLWRVNKTGHLNTPQGKRNKGAPITMESFDFDRLTLGSQAFHLPPGKCSINAVPFGILDASPHSSLNEDVGDGDLVFFDPPYLDVFSDYTKEGFGLTDHTLLAAKAQRCANRGALVIVCGSDSDVSLEVYGKPRVRVGSEQTVGASKRGEVHECLWVYGE